MELDNQKDHRKDRRAKSQKARDRRQMIREKKEREFVRGLHGNIE